VTISLFQEPPLGDTRVIVPILITSPGINKGLAIYEQSVKEHAVEIERLLDTRDYLKKILTKFDY
jgi:hypothetical protein